MCAGALALPLSRPFPDQHHAFTALNAALSEDGAFVQLPAHTTVEEPIHLVFVSDPGASPLVALTNQDLIRTAHEELLDALPAARAAQLVRANVIREPRATFSLAPGQPARPHTRTPVRGLYLAGDWIATLLPATIESAVRSGHRAADLIA